MTGLYEDEKRCAVCGLTSSQTGVLSVSGWGPYDLDGRPPERMRSVFRWAVERCPHCGYCARDIAQASTKAGLIVGSPAYRGLLADVSLPELARRFLCSGLIAERICSSGNEIIDLYLQAAWACDDAGDAKTAAECRVRAAEVLEGFHRHGGSYHARDPQADYVLLADLYRRAGRFEAAESCALEALPRTGSSMTGQQAKLELRLALERDAGRHTREEVVAEPGEGNRTRELVRAEAFALLEQSPHGVRHGNLLRRVLAADPSLDREAVASALWELLEEHPGDVYSPARGMLRMTRFRDHAWRPLVPLPWVKDMAPVNAIEDRYRGTTTYAVVLGKLVDVAQKSGEMLRYADVAEVMGITPRGRHMAKEVGHLLNEICEDEVSRGRPMLPAVVVGSSGLPGAGFFACARTLGLLSPDDSDEREFWEIELAAVREAWGARDPDPQPPAQG